MELFRRRKDGDFEVHLRDDERAVLRSVAPQLRQLLDRDLADPSLHRLFPPAYGDDPERDREYHALVRDELADRRRASIDLVMATLDSDVLSEEELTAWMQAINDLRLVIGTQLDITEDDEELDPDDPDAPLAALYSLLTWLLGHIIDALTGSLPR